MQAHKTLIKKKRAYKTMMTRIRGHDILVNTTLIGIAVVVVSLAVARVIPMSAAAKENLKQYEILEKMSQVDSIAHQRNALLLTMGSGYNPARDRLFQIADNKYHTAQYPDDKFKAAQKLNTLIQEQNAFLQQLGKGSADQKKMFEQLEDEIEQIQLK